MYVKYSGDLSGLLHAHSLKYLLSGKTNTGFGPELFFRPESAAGDSGCPGEGARWWGWCCVPEAPTFSGQSTRGVAGGNMAQGEDLLAQVFSGSLSLQASPWHGLHALTL